MNSTLLPIQRIFFSLMALALLGVLLAFLRRGRLDLRHAIIWLPVAGVILLFSVFPEALWVISGFLGFQVASNAVFSLALIGLLFVVLLQSVALGRAKSDIRDLAQRMALYEANVNRPDSRVK